MSWGFREHNPVGELDAELGVRQHSAECAELPLGSGCICNVADDARNQPCANCGFPTDDIIGKPKLAEVNAALADALEALYLINSDEIGSFDPTPEFQAAIDKARAALRLAGRLP